MLLVLKIMQEELLSFLVKESHYLKNHLLMQVDQLVVEKF